MLNGPADVVAQYDAYMENVQTETDWVKNFSWLSPYDSNHGPLQGQVTFVGYTAHGDEEVPEPSLALLLGLGLGAVSLLVWRWQK